MDPRFRELCEDGPPIKALTFLQTHVAAVVNHADPEEAKLFRALLSANLLATPPRPSVSGSGPGTSTPRAAPAPESSARGDTDSPPPRKRSRPSSPAMGADAAPPSSSSSTRTTSVIRFDVDPVETSEGGSPPSPERYRQRTQMFERLLVFVDESAREPDVNLVDMSSMDGTVL